MKIDATFLRSAASAQDLPHDGLPEVAVVGRSNVGKSSLINALVRERVARTSAEPGKTRLANIYRVARGSAQPWYLVDLPGYGYARRSGPSGSGEADDGAGFEGLVRLVFDRHPAALLLVDVRHPGLASDIDAWRWVQTSAEQAAIVATKIDKLARGQRTRAMRELESVFDAPVLPVSAATGEGLDELWKLIEQLTSSSNNRPQPRQRPPQAPGAATAQPRRKKAPPRKR